MILRLADVLHLPGASVSFPVWDTLIGLCNKEPQNVNARFKIYREIDGSLVVWPNGQTFFDVTLEPQLAFAATFIPGNGFVNPPQNFAGHATVELTKPTPFGTISADRVYGWAMISGENWDNSSPSLSSPVIRSVAQLPDSTMPRRQWILPYVIPNFTNQDHDGPNAYDTGISVQNNSSVEAELLFTYTINQCYAQKGQAWAFHKTVPANGGVRFRLGPELINMGYPTTLNAEGHLDIVSSTPIIADTHAIIATESYQFSAGQQGQIFT